MVYYGCLSLMQYGQCFCYTLAVVTRMTNVAINVININVIYVNVMINVIHVANTMILMVTNVVMGAM